MRPTRLVTAALTTMTLASLCMAQYGTYSYIGALGGRGQEVVNVCAVGPSGTVYGSNDYFPNNGASFRRAWLWTSIDGMDPLTGTPSSGTSSGAYAISGDGHVMVGVLGMSPGAMGTNVQVFRRVDGGANELLPLAAGMNYPQIRGISDDGTTTVGSVNGYGGGGRAVKWDGTNECVMLPNLPDAPSSQAAAVNGDGSVIVGWSGRGYPFDQTPVRWVNGVVEALPQPPGCPWAWTTGVSADGSTVVGIGWAVGGSSRAFKWTPATGMQILQNGFCEAWSISADGRLIGGRTGTQATIWRDGVATSIRNTLTAPGTNLSPFTGLTGNVVISRNGRFAAGSERVIEAPGDGEYHAWAVALPEWLSCFAPTITAQPESTGACGALEAQFSLRANGDHLSHEWMIEWPADMPTYLPLTDGTYADTQTGLTFDAAGTHAATLSIGSMQLGTHAHEIHFVARISNSCGTVQSQIVTLTYGGCPADFDCNGGIDGTDIDAFFAAWEAGESAADANTDGGIDAADIESFFAAWETGSC